ncbi:uncharacterized protein LOC133985301 [Scomber scombrus]|uniref:uncharacterized protein LOC133985301 n=1 Tax=Scomber scombrus TaxID=13677 RepID=UPI002DD9302C|nr:uncharacterized protein LOC133985301 [Scomber scombrus]
MSKSTKPPPVIETWTKEDVHRWLMTEVKVHQTCADRFIEEEVSGENVDDFEKKDILDLGIKHGPAVKIMCYLERLKEGSQHESQLPAYVEKWTKKEVNQWLLQHAKVDNEKAQRFLEEDVSGDCLVCFKKQDFLDLELKSGPAVKILKAIDRLKNKPEPEMLPLIKEVRQSSLKSRMRLSFTSMTRRGKETQKTSVLLVKKGETITNPAPIIKNILDKLGAKDLKSFHFELTHYTDSEHKPIPRGKLEGTDTMDIATLMTNHYSGEVLGVTRHILHKIDQRELVSQVESHMGQIKPYHKGCAGEKKPEDMEKSDSLSSSTGKHEKREERDQSASFSMNVNIKVPWCLRSPTS